MGPNYTGNIYGKSYTKFRHFVWIGQQTLAPRAILVSDWLILQKSSLKPHGQMEPNMTGSIYGRSFTKFPLFVLIRQQIWPPLAILVSDWLIFKKSPETTWPNGTKRGRNHPWQVLYKVSSFCLYLTTNMATTCNSCFWLADISGSACFDWLIFKKSSPLKLHGQMEPNFTGSIYGRSFTKFSHFV